MKTVPLMLGLLAFLALGCTTAAGDNRRSEQAAQDMVLSTALAAVPPYRPREYAAREDINWYLKETEGRHIWYTYALSMEGRPMFYVVSDMKPRNICVSITNPERLVGSGSTSRVLPSPALDGVYYAGAGCDAYYLRDVATGNFIELAGQTFTLISSKVPLGIETDWGRMQFEEQE